jgi:curved DNA-binding protein CbpA
MEAWEVLGNPEKRGHYDQNSGFVNQIKSDTITLTPYNYEWLLSDSDHIWVVQAYDSTSQYCHFFAGFWEEFANKYNGLVKVGRMDVWQQS